MPHASDSVEYQMKASTGDDHSDPGPVSPCQDMRSGRDSSVAMPSTAANQPPERSMMNYRATKATTVNNRNMIVSVMTTPRDPAYSVNIV
jgi:hypothetical protein